MVHLKNPKALILVGGYGTRLRPLTYTIPKPLIPFVNKPILEHQISALVDAGVTEIILALNYYSEIIIEKVKKYEQKYNVIIIYSKEDDVLGTAGPLALARKYLTGDFFVLNSDVICDYPLKSMMEYHLKMKKEATMLTTEVDDPSRYGIVITHRNTNLVKSFVEKPKESLIKQINAGIYIFNEAILKRIELREASLEREIFLEVVKDRQLCSFKLEGFWMDIGQIKDYLIGQKLYIKFFFKKEYNDERVDVKNNVVLGENIKIGENVLIVNSTVFDNVVIGDNVVIKDSIIGWNCKIEDGVKIINGSALGCSVKVSRNCIIDSLLIQPNTCVEL